MIYYKPNFSTHPDSPFARDTQNKLVRRSFWLDLTDTSLVMLFNNGIGMSLTNEEKKNHLIDIKRANLIDKVCIQEILPPED